MSVQSNITRIEGGKASLKTSINNKLNSTQQKITNEHIEDYHLFVDQISGGGGVGTLEIYENGVYDVSVSYSGDDKYIDFENLTLATLIVKANRTPVVSPSSVVIGKDFNIVIKFLYKFNIIL